MAYDVIPTICVAVVLLAAINGITVYSVVKMLVSGKELLERREHHDRGGRIVGIDR